MSVTELAIAETLGRYGFRVVTVPYSRAIGRTLANLYPSETDATVYLVPARFDTRWWRELVRPEHRQCLVHGRVRFAGHRHGAPFPSALIYRGSRVREFTERAATLGDVWVPWPRVVQS